MKIILCGPTCSGKNHLKDKFVSEAGLIPEVSYTTRPPREGEVDGKDYFFISQKRFDKMRSSGLFLETATHPDGTGNSYWYGTTLFQWKESDITIMNRSGLENLSRVSGNYRHVDPDRVLIIHLVLPYSKLLDRVSKRFPKHSKSELNDELEKYSQRFYSEAKDWNDFFSSCKDSMQLFQPHVILRNYGFNGVSITKAKKTTSFIDQKLATFAYPLLLS